MAKLPVTKTTEKKEYTELEMLQNEVYNLKGVIYGLLVHNFDFRYTDFDKIGASKKALRIQFNKSSFVIPVDLAKKMDAYVNQEEVIEEDNSEE